MSEFVLSTKLLMLSSSSALIVSKSFGISSSICNYAWRDKLDPMIIKYIIKMSEKFSYVVLVGDGKDQEEQPKTLVKDNNSGSLTPKGIIKLKKTKRIAMTSVIVREA